MCLLDDVFVWQCRVSGLAELSIQNKPKKKSAIKVLHWIYLLYCLYKPLLSWVWYYCTSLLSTKCQSDSTSEHAQLSVTSHSLWLKPPHQCMHETASAVCSSYLFSSVHQESTRQDMYARGSMIQIGVLLKCLFFPHFWKADVSEGDLCCCDCHWEYLSCSHNSSWRGFV